MRLRGVSKGQISAPVFTFQRGTEHLLNANGMGSPSPPLVLQRVNLKVEVTAACGVRTATADRNIAAGYELMRRGDAHSAS
jgi:hypothetical protein